jgi:two-component system LytT family response regulator
MSKPIRALIVDDEALSRERIRALLAQAEKVEVIAECSNGLQAVEVIESESPDLVFLDVRMPELNGLNVLEAINCDRCPQVIFVTAYDIYMERAFEVHALDYLRKPYTDARFFAALSHARQRIEEQRGYEAAYRSALSILGELRERADRGSERVFVRERQKGIYRVVPTQDIDWIEAHERYARVHVGKEALLWTKTLAEAERLLDPHVFLRVHRSIIVNSARIHTVEPLWKGEYMLKLMGGKSLGTGRTYRAVLESFLNRS